jgi:hypothetical protein
VKSETNSYSSSQRQASRKAAAVRSSTQAAAIRIVNTQHILPSGMSKLWQQAVKGLATATANQPTGYVIRLHYRRIQCPVTQLEEEVACAEEGDRSSARQSKLPK